MSRLNSGLHKIITISDIHFGATDPLYMYNILQDQFVCRLSVLDFDILAICGDLFDSKFMSNNPIVSYAISFIDNVVNLCKSKNATLVLLEGTQSHDNGQLKLFYHYLADPTIDIRIVEQIKFETIKGMRILCIPEKYAIPEETYLHYLKHSGQYDMCFLHGTFKGSFKGSEIATLNSNKTPIFSMESFSNCVGPILMGHYHIAGCYEQYAYYNGSALRYRFGEESEKGFLVTVYNQYSRFHYTELVPIVSKKYVTISINDLLDKDPKIIIDHILKYQQEHGIDYIRVQFNNGNDNINVVKAYFRTNQTVVLQELDKKLRLIEEIDKTTLEQNQQYSYILDHNIDDYTKFVMYVNQYEGSDFITVEELVKLLESKV